VTSAPVAESRTIPPGHYGFGGVLAAEWTKIRSVRSTVWTLVITVVLGVGLSAVVTSARASRFAERGRGLRAAFDPTRASLAGLLLAQLAIGVLGVLVVSAEYSTGTIRDTFSAVPRRLYVLGAKVLVFSGVTLVVGEAVSFSSFLLGQRILLGRTPSASLHDPSALRAVLFGGLYLVLLGLIALGVATIVRLTPAAISTFVGALFVLPIIASLLPSSYANDVGRFLPANIGTVMLAAHVHDTSGFSAWVGLMLLAIYALVLLVVGGYLLVTRDA
jgi:ABC-2 type transport system permease protein